MRTSCYLDKCVACRLPVGNDKLCNIVTCLSGCFSAAAGLVEYLYAEVDTWHTTCTDGTQVFHFASGQAEAHRPDGSKEVCYHRRLDRAGPFGVPPVMGVLSRKMSCKRT